MLKLSIFSNECSLCLFANVSRLESLKFCFKTSRSELCVQSKAFNQLSIFKRIFAFTLENYQNPWSWEKLLPKSSFLLFETSNACNDPFRLHFLGKKLFGFFTQEKLCFCTFSEFIAKNCKPFGLLRRFMVYIHKHNCNNCQNNQTFNRQSYAISFRS